MSVRPQRPQTTSSVARRMVGNALGIKINVTPEQRQQERSKLESARGQLLSCLFEIMNMLLVKDSFYRREKKQKTEIGPAILNKINKKIDQ